jgi:hypothetical protein
MGGIGTGKDLSILFDLFTAKGGTTVANLEGG